MVITSLVLDILYYFHPSDYSCKYSMFIIKPWSRNSSNKELATISIRSTISHTHCKRSIMSEIHSKLIFKFSSPNRLTSTPISIRISRLDHEPFDYSMECHSLIIPVFRQRYKVFTSFRSFF